MKKFAEVVKNSKTIVWNGPAGVFEIDIFAKGTRGVMNAVVEATKSGATTIIGMKFTIVSYSAKFYLHSYHKSLFIKKL